MEEVSFEHRTSNFQEAALGRMEAQWSTMAANARGIYFSSKLYGIKGIKGAREKTATFGKAPGDEVYSGEGWFWLEWNEGNIWEEFEEFELQITTMSSRRHTWKGFVSNGKWVQIRELYRTETEQLEMALVLMP